MDFAAIIAALSGTFFLGLPFWLLLIGPERLAEREIQHIRDSLKEAKEAQLANREVAENLQHTKR